MTTSIPVADKGTPLDPKSKTSTDPKVTIETCHKLFGEHPEDVIAPINGASDALLWLAEILKTISSEALDGCNGIRIKYLAEAGAHLAADIANNLDCQYEAMREHLRAAGVIHAEGDAA